MTLWDLHAALEEELDACLEGWLDDASAWESFFVAIEGLRPGSLARDLRALELVTDTDLELAGRLRRSAEGRAVVIPGTFSGTDVDIAQLALGFTLGETGALVVPYMRVSP